MSLEQSMTQSQKNSFISSNKIHKGNINQVVNYMNSVRKNSTYIIYIYYQNRMNIQQWSSQKKNIKMVII